MGNVLISVHATGIHHNGVANDLDQLAADFVELLKSKGHNVTAATIVSGGEQDLLNTSARYPRADLPKPAPALDAEPVAASAPAPAPEAPVPDTLPPICPNCQRKIDGSFICDQGPACGAPVGVGIAGSAS